MKNKYNVLAFILVGFLMFVLGVMLVIPYLFPSWMNVEYGHMMSGWTMPFGMIGMGLFWLFVLGIIVYALGSPSNTNSGKKNTAIDVLNERLAKGEITIEEYNDLVKIVKDGKR